jgi:hypothetical protein
VINIIKQVLKMSHPEEAVVMPSKFLRWCIDKITIEGPEEVYEYCWGADKMTFYSTDDLFSFWQEKIEGK